MLHSEIEYVKIRIFLKNKKNISLKIKQITIHFIFNLNFFGEKPSCFYKTACFTFLSKNKNIKK